MLFDEYEVLARSGLFDAAFYLAANPDVAATNVDPLLHYLERGASEGREPSADFSTAHYLKQCRRLGETPTNPLLHFVRVGAKRGLNPHPSKKAAKSAASTSLSPERDANTGVTSGLDSVQLQTAGEGVFRLQVDGWAFADRAIAEIALAVDDRILAHAAYGLERPDVAETYQLPRAEHSGFTVVVDPWPADLSGETELTLRVALAEGATTERVLHVDTAQATPGTAIAPGDSSARSVASLRLEVDHVEVAADGVLTLSGWAVCLGDLDAIRIYAGDACLGAAERGLERSDVAEAFKNYPRADEAGFRFSGDVSPLGAGRKTIRVQATTRDGATREALVPISVPHATPRDSEDRDLLRFHCDVLELTTQGDLVVQGWAVAGSETESLLILIDGERIGLAALGVERADVGNLFPRLGHARAGGFQFRRNLGRGYQHGEHAVTLRLQDADGVAREIPLTVEVTEAALAASAAAPAEAENAAQPARMMFIDLPKVVDGVADTPVTNNLAIAGWALAQPGVDSVHIAVDGRPVSRAHYGVRREDVAKAFPDREDALMSGFAALIPNWLLPKGMHTVSLQIRDKAGGSGSVEFQIKVEEIPEGDGPWALREKLSLAELLLQLRVLEGLHWQPWFRVVVAVDAGNKAAERALATLGSLCTQAYDRWDAKVICSNPAAASKLRKRVLEAFAEHAARVEVVAGRTGLFATPKRRRDAERCYICPLSAGDVLGCDALLEMAVCSGVDDQPDFLYCDERRVSPTSNRLEAYFKPGWSPDLLLSTNYVGRVWCAETGVFERADLTADDWLGQGDYELVLRGTEQARKVQHVPKVLCERSDARADTRAMERDALSRALRRRQIKGAIKPGLAPGTYRTQRTRRKRGLVSIIIPTCAARGLIKTCIQTLRKKTAYQNFEIVCIENIPEEKKEWKRWLRRNADKVIRTEEPFNWSRFNNLCVDQAAGEYLLFLNDDIEIIDPHWLDVLLAEVERPEVGVVGPQLLYGDGSVQHAGLALTAVGSARHVFRHAQTDDPGYFGLALTQRNVIGVTGACLLTRKDVFEELGRFDEAHTIVNNDLDYCLKAWSRGYLNVYTPHTQLIHHELASRGELGDKFDSTAFSDKWRDVFLQGDPYLNPNLSRDTDGLAPEREPTRVISAGHPLLSRASVRRILVQKLDHIGDCITGLTALRRLKSHFPDAQISVLASSATRSIWAAERSVDEILDFDFFHARSGLGTKEVGEAQLLELQNRLAPKNFDLAVDLRKSPDTRHVLQYSGARFFAGFDSRGRFPWLDIALEWEGDTRYAAKRTHVADDLLNLVEAIRTSCELERRVLTVPKNSKLQLPAELMREVFRKRVVCIHPASGNETRQWPPEYFAELIDLLLAEFEINVVIVGGPDEMDLAKRVLAHVRSKADVFNLVGKLRLSELPTLISRCALFVGNNSGPQHIAGALGVPTIGIHSGVIDSQEWGPLGPEAVAIRRNMSCAPCYIDKRSDCPRDLACMTGLGPGQIQRVSRRLLAIGAGTARVKNA